MNYLKYIELAAENLQFHLWFRSYCKRFENLPENEKALSPIWFDEHSEVATPVGTKAFNPQANAIFRGTDFAKEPKIGDSTKEKDPFFTPPLTPRSDVMRDAGASFESYEATISTRAKDAHIQRAVTAFENAGLKWKPRELNLPSDFQVL